MSNFAIRAHGLGKRYSVGRLRSAHALLEGCIRAPFHRLVIDRHSSSADSHAPALSAHHVWALKDVSFEVRHGEVIGIIGPNGAGKSALLKILARVTKPTVGYAELHGRLSSMLEADPGFHPELTGRENIYLSGAILGLKKAVIQRKFDEIVALAEVDRFLDTPVKRYSSGMRVRLAFAVAIQLEAEIMLLDEVLSVSDADFQQKCLTHLRAMATAGRTVLLVSHNMHTIKSFCSRTILFRAGRLVRDGATQAVVAAYLSQHGSAQRGS